MNEIYVTSPLLPDLDNLFNSLQDIWQKKYITNSGSYQKKLEEALCEYLNIPFISVMTNCTNALMAALRAADIPPNSQIITTPYTFCATAHSIVWANAEPVFCDVDEATGNISPAEIEKHITEKTSAIMAVHVYGQPCDTEAIQKIADEHNLKVIYDAAHAFGVRKNGKSILLAGDLSCLSFHATKTYNTIEGGAVVCKTKEMKEKLDRIRNFGIQDETSILEIGLNCKMDEVRAAFGLENLKQIDSAIAKRKKAAEFYRRELSNIEGFRFTEEDKSVTYNYTYFPIFIDKDLFGKTADDVMATLNKHNIFPRRYFHPLVSNTALYNMLSSAKKENLKVANKLANEVLCLPIHHELNESDLVKITSTIKECRK